MRTIVALSQPISKAQAEKLDSFAMVFNKAMRQMYVDLIIRKKAQHPVENACILNHNLNARHAKSIRVAVLGKTKSVIELNKEYLLDSEYKLEGVQKKIAEIKNKISNFSKPSDDKSKPGEKLLDSSQKKIIKNLEIYQKKEVRLKRKIAISTEIVKSGNPKLCFGSRKLLKRRTTGYFKSHEAWLEEWRFQRDKEVCFVGSSDETAGNSNAQIRHIKDNDFILKININPKGSAKEKYVELSFTLGYEAETVKKIVANNLLEKDVNGLNIKQALTYRVTKEPNGKKRENQYKVAISFDKHKYNLPTSLDVMSGAVGVDINQDHLAICETNHQGNFVASWRNEYDVTGTTHQNIYNLAQSVKKLVEIAKARNKPIVMEKLDFARKKRELQSGVNKQRNVQLSSFAYNKVGSLILARAQDAGIEVVVVDPSFTSVIGKAKYSKRLGLNVHRSAAYVIARRGMRVREEKTVVALNLDESARMNLSSLKGNAFWTKVRKLMKNENVKPGKSKVTTQLSPSPQQ